MEGPGLSGGNLGDAEGKMASSRMRSWAESPGKTQAQIVHWVATVALRRQGSGRAGARLGGLGWGRLEGSEAWRTLLSRS